MLLACHRLSTLSFPPNRLRGLCASSRTVTHGGSGFLRNNMKVSQQDKKLFWERVNKDGQIPTHVKGLGRCWEWTLCLSGGYGCHRFNKQTFRAHRFAWLISKGKIPNGLLVCHKCDNKKCVRPSHLFIGTYADNLHDALRKGINVPAHGENHVRAKLTLKAVAFIRAQPIVFGTVARLAKMFGVSRPTMNSAIRRLTWKRC